MPPPIAPGQVAIPPHHWVVVRTVTDAAGAIIARRVYMGGMN